MMKHKIVLIVGPSGVGKDSLLRHAKKTLKHNPRFNFVKRYITRAPDINEMNFYLDSQAFDTLQRENYFISSWQAHQNQYGIAKNGINREINIISISRSSIDDFEQSFDDVYTVQITLPKNLLQLRLRQRGRESEQQIQSRLKRSYPEIKAKHLIHFDNSAPLDQAGADFIQLLKGM